MEPTIAGVFWVFFTWTFGLVLGLIVGVVAAMIAVLVPLVILGQVIRVCRILRAARQAPQ